MRTFTPATQAPVALFILPLSRRDGTNGAALRYMSVCSGISTIAVAYMGIMNSRIFGGQTIGKRVMRLKVVTIHGTNLGLSQSLARAAVLGVPVFLNGALFSANIIQSWFMFVLSVLVFGLGLSIVYLYIFNRKTRQSLHDLVVGSIVEKTGPVQSTSFTELPWRGHYFVVAIIMAAACMVPIFTGKLTKSDPFASLLPLQKALASEPGITYANVSVGTSWSKSAKNGAQTQKYLAANVTAANKNADFELMANRLAGIALASYPNIYAQDVFIVSISHGYDIGIASTWTTKNFAFSPSQWQQRIATKSNMNIQPTEAMVAEGTH